MKMHREEETSYAVAIGKRVRQSRLQAKLTQDDLCEITGLSRPSVESIELGKVGVRGYGVVDLMRVCRALGLRVKVLPETGGK